MSALFDFDDCEADCLRAQDRAQRAWDRWRCPACGGGHHHHAQGCPEAIGEDERQPFQPEDDDVTAQ
jgi:hypothetical protein